MNNNGGPKTLPILVVAVKKKAVRQGRKAKMVRRESQVIKFVKKHFFFKFTQKQQVRTADREHQDLRAAKLPDNNVFPGIPR